MEVDGHEILNEGHERAVGKCASLAWLSAGPSSVHMHTWLLGPFLPWRN